MGVRVIQLVRFTWCGPLHTMHMHEALRSVEEVLLPLIFGQALGTLRKFCFRVCASWFGVEFRGSCSCFRVEFRFMVQG